MRQKQLIRATMAVVLLGIMSFFFVGGHLCYLIATPAEEMNIYFVLIQMAAAYGSLFSGLYAWGVFSDLRRDYEQKTGQSWMRE